MPTSSLPAPLLLCHLAWTASPTSVSCRLVPPMQHNSSDPAASAKSPEPQTAEPSQPMGIDAFPSLDSPDNGASDFRVTGVAGTGQDVEREQFESQFPDLSDEVQVAAVRRSVVCLIILTRDSPLGRCTTPSLRSHTVPLPTLLLGRHLRLNRTDPSCLLRSSATLSQRRRRTPSQSRRGGPSRKRRSRRGTSGIEPRLARWRTGQRSRLISSTRSTTRRRSGISVKTSVSRVLSQGCTVGR